MPKVQSKTLFEMPTLECSIKVFHGDNLEILQAMPANSIDSIVTDPPYGLGKEPDAQEMLNDWVTEGHHDVKGKGFMGKEWDAFVPQPIFWRECLRVLKPGGYLLSFAGTRTQDLMALGLRIAGFEIRDCVMWVYGSGFPKSLDVSKAIDKLDVGEVQERRRLQFTAWVRSQGVTSRQIDEATGTNMGGHYTTAASQPAVMTRKHLEACRHLFRDVPEWVEQEADQRTVESENFNRRGFYETSTGGLHGGSGNTVGCFTGKQALPYGVTDAARQWQGWGTALKPAYEPVIVARKPLAGTVAENVLKWGTGGLNIDDCRVQTEDKLGGGMVSKGRPKVSEGWDRPWMHYESVTSQKKVESAAKVALAEGLGRFPANLIHDGSDEVISVFPTDGSGNAARFFYSPKVGKEEREFGMDEFDSSSAGEVTSRKDGSQGLNSPRAGAGRTTGSRNVHPTVKPVDLMRYLCRLVTPPGGIVLDPFAGSGTTGIAATIEKFRAILIEREDQYAEICRARVGAAKPMGNSDLWETVASVNGKGR